LITTPTDWLTGLLPFDTELPTLAQQLTGCVSIRFDCSLHHGWEDRGGNLDAGDVLQRQIA